MRVDRPGVGVLLLLGAALAAAQAPAAPPAVPADWPNSVREAGREPDAGEAVPPMGGAAWRVFLGHLERAAQIVQSADTPQTPIDTAEGYRHLAVLLHLGLGELLLPWDPERPVFHFSDGTGKWGLDCADALYAQAPLRGGARYRVRGRRGTVHFMGFQVMAGTGAAADLDADALARAPDGSFELVLSAEREPGNWLALPPDASALIVRQFFYDWDREQPGTLTIERIDDAPAPGAGVDPTGQPGPLGRKLDALGRFVVANTQRWAEIAVAKRAQANRFPDDHGIGSIAGASQAYQAFGIGYFQLADDQALIVEVKPPRAKYWSLHLGNYWMESLDYANHASSLNGHQAVLDRDGVLRAVVSLRDPGVPNWLDPAGHGEGSMIYRWNQADGAPVPTARVVPFAELRQVLPPETPRLDEAARRAQIERRREHVRRRFARPL